MNVAERLLNDAKNGQLDGLRETANLGSDLKVHCDFGALGKTINHPASGRDQARFVEQRWIQKLRESANLLETFIDPLSGFGDGFFVRFDFAGFDEGIKLKLGGGKFLAGGIV